MEDHDELGEAMSTACWHGDHHRCRRETSLCYCECHAGNGPQAIRETPVPPEPVLSMGDVVTQERRSRFLAPGDIPSMDDVAAVIAERGRWGDPPRYVKCEGCNFPVFDSEDHCAACNAPRPVTA